MIKNVANTVDLVNGVHGTKKKKNNKKKKKKKMKDMMIASTPAEILGDPYSKKSPLPSIGEFPSVCHPTYSRLPSTWSTTTSAATHYTQQPP